MKFDKPVVLLEDIPEILSMYGPGPVLETKYLGGVPNVTYRVITPSSKLAIRICNHGYTSIEHLETEIELLSYLHAAGFEESPIPVYGTNGMMIQNWRGYRTFAMKLIEGVPGDRSPITSELCFDVGRTVAQMQKLLRNYARPLPDGESYTQRSLRLLEMLPITSKTMGWRIDFDAVLKQWNRASEDILRHSRKMSHGVIHTDIWPPNVICADNKIVGVVDFDDWSYGASFIDPVAALTEFPMFNRLEFNEDLAYALLKGYFAYGGRLSDVEHRLLLVGMETLCASWLACNALHRIQFEESAIYVKKLELLRDSNKRKALSAQIDRCINAAINDTRKA